MFERPWMIISARQGLLWCQRGSAEYHRVDRDEYTEESLKVVCEVRGALS